MTDTALTKTDGTGIAFGNAMTEVAPLVVPARLTRGSEAYDAAVAKARSELNPDDASSVATWGAPVLRNIDAISRDLIGHARATSAGAVGRDMETVILRLKDYEVSDVEGGRKWLDRITSLFVKAKMPLEVLRERYGEINDQIDAEVRVFDDDIGKLIKSQVAMERLFGAVAKAYVDLHPYEDAARQVLADKRDRERPALLAAQEAGDPMAGSDVLRLDGQLSMIGGREADFAKAATNLHTILVIISNTINDQNTVIGQAQSTLSSAVPLWRTRCAIALKQDELAKASGHVRAAREYEGQQAVSLAKMARKTANAIDADVEAGTFSITAVMEATNETVAMLQERRDSMTRRFAQQREDLAKAEECVGVLERAATGVAFEVVSKAGVTPLKPTGPRA